MDNLPEHIEMKIKRPLHLRCRLSDKLHAPKPLGDRLQASLAHTYNHLDRLRFLEQFQLFTPKEQTPQSLILKDYAALDEETEVLERYVGQEDYRASFGKALLQYRIYEDTPRMFILGVEAIVIRHLEAQRVRKEGGEMGKEEQFFGKKVDPCQVLLKTLLQSFQSDKDNTILRLKKCIDNLTQTPWVDFLPVLNLDLVDFTHLDLQKWGNCVVREAFGRLYKPKIIRNQVETLHTENVNVVSQKNQALGSVESEALKKTILRMRTINSNEKPQQNFRITPLFTVRLGKPIPKLHSVGVGVKDPSGHSMDQTPGTMGRERALNGRMTHKIGLCERSKRGKENLRPLKNKAETKINPQSKS